MLIMPLLQRVIIVKNELSSLKFESVVYVHLLLSLSFMQTSSRDLGRASIVFDLLSCPGMSRKLRGNDSHTSILFVKVTVRGIAKHHKMWQ